MPIGSLTRIKSASSYDFVLLAINRAIQPLLEKNVLNEIIQCRDL